MLDFDLINQVIKVWWIVINQVWVDSDVIKVWNTREGINLEWDICNEEIFSERTDWFSGKDLITLIVTLIN